MAQQIRVRRGTAAEWTSANPILADGELGVEKDKNRFKLGDGVTAWVSLPYFSNNNDHNGTYAPLLSASAATAAVMHRLKQGVDDVTILCIGDSTGVYSASEPRWVYKLAQKVAPDWPAYTVKFYPWNDATPGYDSAIIVQTGTGSHTLNFYNASVSGTVYDYFLGSKYDAAVQAIAPDLVFTNFGHNDGSGNVTGAANYARDRIVTLTETIAATAGASIVILAQNERQDVTNDITALRAARYALAAEHTGHGFIDIRRAFLNDSRGLTALLNVDNLHPNNTGSDLWASTIYPHMQYREGVAPRQAALSSFLVPVSANLVTNGDFSSFASPPTLPNWTGQNATLAKDTTNYEGPNGYSVNATATTAAQTYIYQDINLRTVKGHYITAAARIWLPTGQNASAGCIAIEAGDGDNRVSLSSSTARQGWHWVVVSKRIPASSTNVRIKLYMDTTASGSANISIDRIVVAKGRLPRDVR